LEFESDSQLSLEELPPLLELLELLEFEPEEPELLELSLLVLKLECFFKTGEMW
jgi:hypothetical protein